MPAKITPALRAEHRELTAVWRKAADVLDRSPIGGTDHQIAAEEDAYEALCDWAEEHNLNYSELDIRGTEDPTDADDEGNGWAR